MHAQHTVTGLTADTTMRRRAAGDSLTGLPDRRVLDRWPIELIGRAATSVRAVLWIDIDGLTEVNDLAGYPAGDELLVQFAARLQECLHRPGDMLVRLGGDEFALGLTAASADIAAGIGERIVQIAAEPFLIDGQTIDVTACVGLGLAGSFGTDEPEAPIGLLLSLSCAAMRQAKASGRGRLSTLTDTDPAAAALVERGDICRRIKPALAAGQFELHYQPLFEIATGQLREVEALLRWNDAELGRLFPASFIPVAEHTGQIVALGRWALREACLQAHRWQAAGTPRTVAVNLSPLQLTDPNLVGDVQDALAAAGLAADALRLEITESEAIRDFQGTSCRLSELRGLGVHLSLDDFGTGYSSLAMLRELPVDTIKIDRSFVQRLDQPANHADTVLVGAVIDTAHAFGLDVVAEGVERAGQLAALTQMGCDLVQGFLLGHPQPT
jgi:diguanylate cyclase (GGDEF)-like protein